MRCCASVLRALGVSQILVFVERQETLGSVTQLGRAHVCTAPAGYNRVMSDESFESSESSNNDMVLELYNMGFGVRASRQALEQSQFQLDRAISILLQHLHFDPLHRRAHCRGIARWEGGGGI
eukprot:COSAG01_NODE_1676_length_9521_cov_726.849926_2_plen_123_part_00